MMKTKDSKRKEKINNNNLKSFKPGGPAETEARAYANQQEGIIKLERSLYSNDSEFHTIQEQHNANHALYYFSIISDALIRGRHTGNDCEKVRRIIDHMMNLREFIGKDKDDLKQVLNALLSEIRKFCPGRKKQFAEFIYNNWNLIRSFAEAYGHHDRCFPEEKHQKLYDVITGRCYVRTWWLKMKAQKMLLKMKRMVEKVAK